MLSCSDPLLLDNIRILEIIEHVLWRLLRMLIIRDRSLQHILEPVPCQELRLCFFLCLLLDLVLVDEGEGEGEEALRVSVEVRRVVCVLLAELFFLKFVDVEFLAGVEVDVDAVWDVDAVGEVFCA